MKRDLLLYLYNQNQTVFSLNEMYLNFPKTPQNKIKRSLKYYASVGKLLRIRRGIYGKEGFNPQEVAGKIFTPSYISFETVLFNSGVIFQPPKNITVASYLNRFVSCLGFGVQYKKVKNAVLLNTEGLIQEVGFVRATPERAFLDLVFIYKDYYFDNLRVLNWEIVFKLPSFYQSKALVKRVGNYYKNYKSGI